MPEGTYAAASINQVSADSVLAEVTVRSGLILDLLSMLFIGVGLIYNQLYVLENTTFQKVSSCPLGNLSCLFPSLGNH